jgi:phospholipid/cholesterol/gamma-HCH transport system ATP-binding protein
MTTPTEAVRRNTGWVPGVPVLEVRDLTGPVGDPVVHDVNLVLQAAQTHVVLGLIHSGKSMLMRLLLGLERAESGQVIVEGRSYDATGETDTVTRDMRRRIGVVFEGSALLSRISIVENVELPLLEHRHTDPRDARDAAQELLRLVGMNVAEDTTPLQLGRAEQRRVALARALALDPGILLMDEPSHGLDPHAAAELDDTVKKLQQERGFGVLIASHEARYAFRGANQISVMANGRIVEQGNRDQLQASQHEVVRQLLNRRGAR